MRQIGVVALLTAAVVHFSASGAEAAKSPAVAVHVDANLPGTVAALADAIERALTALSRNVFQTEVGRVRFTLGKIAGEELELAAAMEVATWKRERGEPIESETAEHLTSAVAVIRKDLDALKLMLRDSGRLRDLDPALVSGLYCFVSDGYVRGYGFGAGECGYPSNRPVKFEGTGYKRPGQPDAVAALRAEAAGLQQLATRLGTDR